MKKQALFLVVLMAALLALAGCSQQPAETEGRATSKGRVVSIDTDQGVLTLNHEEIPKMMMAMTMPFPVEDKKLLEGLAVDDAVEFDVEQKPALTIVAIRKIDPSELGPGASSSFEGKATVFAVNPDANSIAIIATGIPGIPYDPNDPRPLVYAVNPPSLLDGIKDDDVVEITLKDDGKSNGQLVVTKLKKVEEE